MHITISDDVNGGFVSFFSEEDKAANSRERSRQAAVNRDYKRQAPLIAYRLIDLLDIAARREFRTGRDVTIVQASDRSQYPHMESSPYVPEEVLREVIVPLIERRFGRTREEFHLFINYEDDIARPTSTPDTYLKVNRVFVRFNEPLR